MCALDVVGQGLRSRSSSESKDLVFNPRQEFRIALKKKYRRRKGMTGLAADENDGVSLIYVRWVEGCQETVLSTLRLRLIRCYFSRLSLFDIHLVSGTIATTLSIVIFKSFFN